MLIRGIIATLIRPRAPLAKSRTLPTTSHMGLKGTGINPPTNEFEKAGIIISTLQKIELIM